MRLGNLALKVSKVIGYVVIIITAVMIANNSFRSFTAPTGFMLSKGQQSDNIFFLTGLYVHIVSAPLFLIAGLLQFSKIIRKKMLHIHKYAGRVYVLIVLFFAGPSALLLAAFAPQFSGKLCFFLLSAIWIYYSYRGYRNIREGDVNAHKTFMVRSYALSVSAILLRIYSFLFVIIFNESGENIYIMLAWLSWLPQFLLLELYFLLKNKTKMARVA